MVKNFICLCLSSLIIVSCKVKKIESTSLEKAKYIFPVEWVGHYKGQLKIYKRNDQIKEIPMELIIDHPNSEGYYPWTLIYDNKDYRSYGLESINPEVGHYRIDEFNSIKIDAFLNNGKLASRFEVMDSDLVVIYERVPHGMQIEFLITHANEISTTGQEIIGTDTIPSVNSFGVVVYQMAHLKKLNP